MSPLGNLDATRVFVFSHPNHEAAVLGLVQRLRPHLVYLTDGGGERRVDETRRALTDIDLADRACFLDHSEESFYQGLLDRKTSFFTEIAESVRALLVRLEPEQVFCDAAEFYNPVHDMSLPIARAALRDRPGTPVFEIPLIYQKPGEEEAYEIQRVPASQRESAIPFELTQSELSVKTRARSETYHMLRVQLGPLMTGLTPGQLAHEEVSPARESLPEPGSDRVLRYEWRGRLLQEKGEVPRVITYADHYAPVASELWGAGTPVA